MTIQNKVIIFDFDGTIADTYHHLIKISNRLATEFDYKVIDLEEASILRDKPSHEILDYLNIPIRKVPAILARAKREFYKEIIHVQSFDGMKETLLQLKKHNLQLGILSSNKAENINRFLNHHKLNFFDFIQATSRIWSKNIALTKLIRSNGFELEQILYVGDETRDILAARKSGIKIATVTWGYNSRDHLRKYNPDYLVNHPDELYQICVDL